jgi:hypothetical protein
MIEALRAIAACEPDPGEDDVDADRQLDACIDRMIDIALSALDEVQA